MARLPRIVVPGYPHHVTQRGKGRHTRTGRPMGDDAFVAKVERLVVCTVRPGKPGPKARRKKA